MKPSKPASKSAWTQALSQCYTSCTSPATLRLHTALSWSTLLTTHAEDWQTVQNFMSSLGFDKIKDIDDISSPHLLAMYSSDEAIPGYASLAGQSSFSSSSSSSPSPPKGRGGVFHQEGALRDAYYDEGDHISWDATAAAVEPQQQQPALTGAAWAVANREAALEALAGLHRARDAMVDAAVDRCWEQCDAGAEPMKFQVRGGQAG